jgi:hypothetical protein
MNLSWRRLTDFSDPEIYARAVEFARAPVDFPGILPDVLPLLLGAFIIELYFGRHENEMLGWNTSVGNAVIWVSTGLSLLITGVLDTAVERGVTYLILLSGAFTGYMDFFHKWSAAAAFRASSPDVIYPIAYVTVVAVKTDMPIELNTFKAAAAFSAGATAFFMLIKWFIPPQEGGGLDSRF